MLASSEVGKCRDQMYINLNLMLVMKSVHILITPSLQAVVF